MKIKKNLTWKDAWIENSQAPMTEMFYRAFKRLPTDEELRKFIDIFVIPRSQKVLEKEFKEFSRFVDENDKKRAEGI